MKNFIPLKIMMVKFGNQYLHLAEFFTLLIFGRIKRIGRVWYSGKNLSTRKEIPEGIVKIRVVSGGYTKCTLCYNKIKKSYAVHRLIALTFLDKPNNYKEINHIDGVKYNNKLENLEWCSRSQNQLHAIYVLRNGHTNRIGKTLNKEIADKIRKYKLENPKSSYQKISEIFNITFQQAYDIIKNNSYS